MYVCSLIGIGFVSEKVVMNRLPGWEPESWGYHGDDGNVFSSHGPGKKYGPVFAADDVIGCGVSFYNNTAFFTKNGQYLGNNLALNFSPNAYLALVVRHRFP